MRTRLLYQEDSYIREFEAAVLDVLGSRVVLSATAFHDGTGGVEADSGRIIFGAEEYGAAAAREGDEVVHVLDRQPAFAPGDTVRGVLDWDRRYRKMRLHTAAHIIAAVLYNRHGALVTGGGVTHEYARFDFSIEGDAHAVRRALEEAVLEANEIARRGVEVKIYWLPREEALRIPGVVKLAERLPPGVPALRIVEIPGVDAQADGGPHVRNTREIGEVEIVRIESRGKNRKRLYFTVK
ncbi:MAG: alanyl-tRNA editing protein [Thermoproteaceae archaeon]|nr:alanyl-tRNA editing protein [Thermoproteaceae archaeon]